jgi:hypothetical protein
MTKIWVRISDGKNVSAVSTKEKALLRVREKYDCSKKKAEKLLEDEEGWQEIFLD